MSNTIRELRSQVREIHIQQGGPVFNKIKLGKSVPQMSARELKQSLDHWRELMRLAPPSGTVWNNALSSSRIHIVYANGWPYTVYLQFDQKTDAYKFQEWVMPWCSWSLLRPAKHFEGKGYEVKLWVLDRDVLRKLVAKDQQADEEKGMEVIEVSFGDSPGSTQTVAVSINGEDVGRIPVGHVPYAREIAARDRGSMTRLEKVQELCDRTGCSISPRLRERLSV